MHAHTAPLVDGNCAEYKALQVEPIKRSDDVSWFAYEDHGYLWFCFAYPKSGYGILDLQIETDKLTEIFNLHASTQLSEWPIDKLDMVPKTPASEL